MLELEKLDRAFKGLKEMKRVPEIIFVIDGEFESQAIKEANSLNLTSFAVSNTNGDPLQTTDIIPCNTNSVKSLEFIASALKAGFKAPAKKPAPARAVKPAPAKKAPAKKTAAAQKKKETPASDSKKEEKTAPEGKKTKGDELWDDGMKVPDWLKTEDEK